MKKLFFFSLLLICSGLMIAQDRPTPVTPVFEENLFTGSITQLNGNVQTDGFATLSEAFNYGGDRLVTMQYTDGGWGWPLNAPPTYANILGPIAMGLAQAYQQTGIVTQRTALINAGTFLLTKTNNFSPSDGYLAAQLDKIFGGATYVNHVKINFYDQLAAGTYNRNGAGTLYTTASYVNLIRTSRSGDYANMAAWDIGMGLVGASMCGASTEDWSAGVKAEINELDGENYYDVIGLAGAIYGLAFVNEDFDPTAGWHIAASNINDLAATLASYQIAGGGFAWNQAYVIPNDGNEAIQETAYAILALNEVNRTLYLSNIQGAANYTMSVQLGNGGWENYVGNGENNELTGEALWGMSVAYPAAVYNITKDVFYPTIQGAVSDANSGNTITVASGIFAGNITVNKSLTILGDPGDANPGPGINAPIIDGGSLPGDAFLIANGVTNVTIKGFEMRNFTSPLLDGIGNGISAWVGSTSDIIIQDNYFHNLGYNGVLVGNDYSSNPANWGDHTNWLIKNNIIESFGYIGFELTNTSNSSIEGNIIHLATPYIGAIFSSARRSETGLTVKNNFIDGTPSTSFPVIYMYAYDLDMPNPNLNSVLIKENDISTIGTPFQIYIRNIGTGTVTGVNINNNNIGSLKNLTSDLINAEYNWWGSANPNFATIISGNVDYDPWIGKAEMVSVSQTTPTVYDFPIAGVKMVFSTLPSGGGNVTVTRYNEAPTPFPSGYTNVGMWLDITSAMANYSFDVTIYVDVFGIPGFDATTTVMYYNSSTSTWVAVVGGTFLGSDPMFGGHPSFSFVTNHFTPFTFINTPATAKNVYLSTSNTVIGGTIYPNTDWEVTGYEGTLGDDWDFTTPVSLYIVPEVGSQFGASTITIQWDNTVYNYVGVDKTGGIYDNSAYFFNTLPSANQVIIDAGRYDNTNFTITSGQYIAKINFNLIKPGFNPINFSALDFRAFDGSGGQLGVFVTGNNAQVKSYLGDVASHTSTLTGDGLVDFYDLSPWSGSYWSGVGGFGMDNYKVKYDIGPTSTNNVYGIPAVDGRIQFEDFVIFAMSYGLSANNVYPKIEAEPTEPVDLQLGEPIIAGNQTRIPLFVSGGVQNVRAMSLTFAGQFGKLVSVEKGSLLTEFTNPVIVMSNVDGNQVYVDLAVFGAEELGINTEGEVLTLIFEGNTEININTAEVRNILNGPMAVNISGSEGLVPSEFALMQNYPNPFNPTTTINYNLPAQAMVEVSIYNALGERVAMLVNEIKEAGRHTVEFNASGYSSGIYFYQIKANDFVSVKKMILMK